MITMRYFDPLECRLMQRPLELRDPPAEIRLPVAPPLTLDAPPAEEKPVRLERVYKLGVSPLAHVGIYDYYRVR